VTDYGVFLTFFTVLLIVTGAAFAQVADGVSVGGWGKAVFVPVQGQFKDDRAYFGAGVGSGWGPAYARVDVTFAAADSRIGGQARIERGSEPSSINGGLVNIWAKPFGSDILYVQVGKYEYDEFRGKVGTDGDFHNLIGGPGKSPDRIFQRLNGNGSNGGGLLLTKPISGLSIFADIGPGWYTYKDGRAAVTGENGAQDIYKKIQAGIAYDISGIGLFRAQWVGNTMDITAGESATWRKVGSAITASQVSGDPEDWELIAGDANPYVFNPARIEAAFNLKAVEGLNLDLSVKVPIPVEKEILTDVKLVHQGNFQIGAAGEYKAGDFGVVLGLYGEFGGSTAIDVPDAVAESQADGYFSTKAKLAPSFDIIVTPSFFVTAIDATLGADVGFKVKGKDTIPEWLDTAAEYARGQIKWVGAKESTTFGFGGWIKRDLGKGYIKTGLAYQFPTYGAKGTVGKASYLTWPIVLELSF
jgi:hypothetical protein